MIFCGPFDCSHELSFVDMRFEFYRPVPVGRLKYLCAAMYVFCTHSLLGCFFHQSTDRTAQIQRGLNCGLILKFQHYPFLNEIG